MRALSPGGGKGGGPGSAAGAKNVFGKGEGIEGRISSGGEHEGKKPSGREQCKFRRRGKVQRAAAGEIGGEGAGGGNEKGGKKRQVLEERGDRWKARRKESGITAELQPGKDSLITGHGRGGR